MIRASIGIADSLAMMEQSEGKARVSEVYAQIHMFLAQGHSVSSALSRASDSFSTKTISLLRLAEETGGLVACLNTLAEDFEAEVASSREIRAALTYPMVVSAIALLSFGGLFAYLVPKMLELLESLDAQLPAFLAFALNLYQTLSEPWVLFILSQFLLAGYVLWRRLRQRPDFQVSWDRLVASLPVFGQLSHHFNAFQFARGMRTLLEAGCPTVKGLKLLRPSLTNAYYGSVLAEVIDDVSKQGNTVSEAMKSHGLFQTPFHQMLSSGEESGKTTEILDVIGRFYQQRYRDILGVLEALLEPAVLLFLGLAVGGLALGFFLPLMNVLGNL